MESLTQEEFAIVKLAAAKTYKARNIHPTTASYLFDRKMAKLAGVKPTAPSQPAVKKQAAVKKQVVDTKMKKIAGLAKNLKKVLATSGK